MAVLHATPTDGPTTSASLLTRTRLLDELDGWTVPLVCVTAGPGCGKTVLAHQRDEHDERRFLWLRLHRSDDDPVVLVRELIDVLGGPTGLGASVDLSEAGRAAREPAPRFAARVMPLLGRALDSVAEPFVLVVDEVEVLGDVAADVLSQVLDVLPRGAQAMVLGRRMHPSLRTARREADGSARRVDAAELAFNAQEIEELLALRTGRSDRSRASEIRAQTMGWPLGTRLVVDAAAGRGRPASHPARAEDGDQLLRRYVREELLAPLDDATRRFLLDTSVLDWLDVGLCDSVLDRTDSGRILATLRDEGRGVFVEGGGRNGDRFHPMVRAALLEELREADPGRMRALRLRSVTALESLGHHRAAIDTALDAAIDAADVDLAAEVLFRHLPTIMFRGEYASLHRWLAQFDEGQRHRSGLLALAEAWLAFVTNRRTDLARWLAVAEQLEPEGPLPDGSASFEIALASLRMVPGLDGALASSRDAQLVRRAGPGGSPWWGIAGGIETITRIHSGLEPDPIPALRDAEFESRGIHVSHATTCSHLGYELLRAGDADAGLTLVRDAVREIVEAELVDFPLSGMVHCTSAYAEALHGSPDRARAAAEQARAVLDSVSDVVDRAQVHGHLLLGDADLALGDAEGAARDLRVAHDRLRAQPGLVVLRDWADSLQRRLCGARSLGVPDISEAERRVLRQLPTHQSLAEIGDELYLSRNTVKSHAMAIYRKLGVSSRSDAVRVAKELELL